MNTYPFDTRKLIDICRRNDVVNERHFVPARVDRTLVSRYNVRID